MATEKFIIKIEAQGAKEAKKETDGLKDSVGDKNKGLTGAFTKALLAVEAFKFGLNAVTNVVTSSMQIIADQTAIAINEFKEFEQGSLGMARTLGITKDEALELSKAFYSIKTPSSIEELQSIGQIAGQLGVAKDEALKFVDAVDKINVSLGDEFSGGAIQITSELGKIANQFGLVDEQGRITAQGILDIGNAINELGASGVATGPFISDFGQRVGGIAKLAKISVGDTLGLGAAMEELGQSSEVAGTAIQQIILKMGKDVPKFAAIAGVSVEEFSSLLDSDANEALLTFAKGLSGSGLSVEELAHELDGLGIDGSRAISVLSALGQNTDMVRQKQDLAAQAIEENQSINDEFQKSLTTLEFAQSQVTKSFDEARVSLVGAFAPAIGDFMNTYLTPFVSKILDGAVPAIISLAKEGVEFFGRIIEENKPSIDSIVQLVGTFIQQIKDNPQIQEDIKTIGNNVKEAFSESTRSTIKLIVESVKDFMEYITSEEGQEDIEDLTYRIELLTDFVRSLAHSFSLATDKVSDFLSKAHSVTEVVKGFSVAIPNLPKFHDGGMIPGSTGQEVPIMAQAGEYVIDADTVKAIRNGQTYESNSKSITNNVTINNNGSPATSEFMAANLFNMLAMKI